MYLLRDDLLGILGILEADFRGSTSGEGFWWLSKMLPNQGCQSSSFARMRKILKKGLT